MRWTRRAGTRRARARLAVVAVLVGAAVTAAVPGPWRPHELNSSVLDVVALGDSVPTGHGCDCRSFAQVVADDVGGQVGRPTRLDDDAADGATSEDVLDRVHQPQVRADLDSAALVLVMAGANDVPLDPGTGSACPSSGDRSCLGPTVTALRTALTGTVRAAQASPSHPVVVLIGYWNVGVDGAVARGRGADFLANSRAVTSTVNDVIAQVARATGSVYVDSSAALLGPQGSRDPTPDLQDDGDHPDDDGHRRIAAAVTAALRTSGALATLRDRTVLRP